MEVKKRKSTTMRKRKGRKTVRRERSEMVYERTAS